MALTRLDTGWDEIANTDSMLGNDQIGDAAHHAEDIAATTADTWSDLAGATKWLGRQIWVIDSKAMAFSDGTTWLAAYVQPVASLAALNAINTLPTGTRARVVGSATASENGSYTWSGAAWVGDDSGWIAQTLLNSWQNFGGSYATAGARRINGITSIKGVVKSGSITAGTNILQLPTGWGPGEQILRSTTANSAFATLTITAGGAVQTASVPSNASLSLDLSFPSAQS